MLGGRQSANVPDFELESIIAKREFWIYLAVGCTVFIFIAVVVVIRLKISHYEKNQQLVVHAKNSFIISKKLSTEDSFRAPSISQSSSFENDPAGHEYLQVTQDCSKSEHYYYPISVPSESFVKKLKTVLVCNK